MQEKIMMQVTLCMYNTFEDKAVWVDLLDFWGGKPANVATPSAPVPGVTGRWGVAKHSLMSVNLFCLQALFCVSSLPLL